MDRFAQFALPLGEWLILILIACAAVAMRLPNIGEPVDNYDEGVYLQSLWMMARGYQPFHDLTATQGPLHLYSQFPFFLLFDQTVAAGRSASVIWSTVGLAGVWWIARQLGGPLAGVAAALLLTLSPTYLRFSRQALADLPALAPALLAVGAGLAYRRTGRQSLLVGASVLMALGILMKPIVAPAMIALMLIVWRPSRSGWRDLSKLGLGVALTIGSVLLMLGPYAVFDQILGFRNDARSAFGWSLAGNWWALVEKLNQDQVGFFALGLVGLGLTALKPWRAGLPVGLWMLASCTLLLTHAPLHYHNMVILIPPLAVLGGLAISALPAMARPRTFTRLLAGVTGATLVLYMSAAPELVRRDARILENIDAAGAGSHEVDDVDAAAERIRRLTEPGDVILTDYPYLAFLADRRVPPELLDPSDVRIRAGDFTDEWALGVAMSSAPTIVVLWDNKLRRLPKVMDWVEEHYEQDRRFGTGDGQPRVIMRLNRPSTRP
ncbi:MAG: ArnT family glycosyltransferase [Chloroflexota bacterium]